MQIKEQAHQTPGAPLENPDTIWNILGNPSVVHMLTDSSPQGGRDWLLTESYIWSKIGRVFLWAREFITTTRGVRDAGVSDADCHEDAERCRELEKNLKAEVRREASPPAGLGYRRTNAAHKASAFARQCFLVLAGHISAWFGFVAS